MTYLLDTNTCIRYLNGRSPQVKARLQSLRPEDIVLCSVVKAELNYGAAQSRDPERTMARIAEFEAPFTSLPFDDSCVDAYGQIRSELEKAGTPIGPNDLMIAAIALTHGLTLVTHITREFQRVARLSWADWEV